MAFTFFKTEFLGGDSLLGPALSLGHAVNYFKITVLVILWLNQTFFHIKGLCLPTESNTALFLQQLLFSPTHCISHRKRDALLLQSKMTQIVSVHLMIPIYCSLHSSNISPQVAAIQSVVPFLMGIWMVNVLVILMATSMLS